MDAVAKAAARKRQAEAAYRDAIVHAREVEGRSAASIAEAAGITRSAVYQIVEGERKRREGDEVRMQARLDELDAKWAKLVDEVSEAFMPADPRAEQAIRNGVNAKAKRAQAGVRRDGKRSGSVGSRAHVRITVRQEARNLAESKILRMLEHRADEPLVQRIVSELDEASALREKLTTLRDTRVFGSPV